VKGQQLPLSVQLRDPPRFDNFVVGPNGFAVSALRRLAVADDGPRAILLHGPAGSGRTHLLQALVRAAAHAGRSSIYLPLISLRDSGPEALDGFSRIQVVAFDDVDAVVQDRQWALAVLRLTDELRARNARWAASSVKPAIDDTGMLPDLRTRLSAAMACGLAPLNDVQRAELLHQAATMRGLRMPDYVCNWILGHLPRDNASLVRAIERLDGIALPLKGRLTHQFLEETLLPAPPAPPP